MNARCPTGSFSADGANSGLRDRFTEGRYDRPAPALTTRGLGVEEMREIARLIEQVHEHGGVVWHDATSIRFAEKAQHQTAWKYAPWLLED